MTTRGVLAVIAALLAAHLVDARLHPPQIIVLQSINGGPMGPAPRKT